MRILLTNDDGIESEGLRILFNFAKNLGECVIVAPKNEQSGKSHSVELHKSFEVGKVLYDGSYNAFFVDSTPSDCVRFALSRFGNFDLLLSGINKGYNIGSDILYSGTCGAVFEGEVLGIKNSIAFSTHQTSFDYATLDLLNKIWSFLEKYEILRSSRLLNINIPPRYKGIKITRQGGRFFHDDFIDSEEGKVKAKGHSIYSESNSSLSYDTDAVIRDRYISISPLTIDRTDAISFEALKGIKEEFNE